MTVDDDTEVWKEVGSRLAAGRRAMRLSKRAAATKAGFAEITWRQLEDGERQISRGVKVPVSPKDDTLEAAALAVGVSPEELFALVGRTYEPRPERTIVASGGDLDELRRLDPEYAAAVERMIEAGIAQARARRP